MEFHTQSHVFENCQEALRHVLSAKSELNSRIEKKERLSFSDYTKVANDFLALNVQFEKAITTPQLKKFEHFPRLAKDYATEVLKQLTFDMRKEHQQEFINLYIENFEVGTVIN